MHQPTPVRALAVEVTDLTRSFSGVPALSHVTFSATPGEVVALLGHNGAGKTTLLRVINGLLAPTDGQVRTLGMDPGVDGQAVRSRTGVLTEYPALDDFLTPVENLATYGAMYGVGADELGPRVDELLARLGLDDKRDMQCRDLSAGLRQRVALARALLHQPELLLLDEPTSNLDPLAAKTVRELVVSQSRDRGTTVVVSTHNLAEAHAIADRVVVLRQGRVLAVGPIRDLGRQAGSRVTITVADPGDARAAVELVGDLVGPVERHADIQSFTASIDVVPTHRVIAALVSAGIDVAAAVPQEPSLEDIYIALHHEATPALNDGIPAAPRMTA